MAALPEKSPVRCAALSTVCVAVVPRVLRIAFVVAEEERAVLERRTAEAAAELVLLQVRLGDGEVVLRFERVVAIELPAGAVDMCSPPDLVTTLTTDPALRPYSAPCEWVMILNSWIASGGGRRTKPVLNVSLLDAPSSRKLFDWFRMPLTLKPPVALPKPPGVASPAAPPSPEGGATTPRNQRAELREVAAVQRELDDLLLDR